MQSETSGQKRARLRGTFTPTPGSGYNRHGRKVLARKLTREGRAELLEAGCDLLEARKEAANPKRVPVKWLLSRVWKAKAEAKRLKDSQRGKP
jgi:hypothetical protein